MFVVAAVYLALMKAEGMRGESSAGRGPVIYVRT